MRDKLYYTAFTSEEIDALNDWFFQQVLDDVDFTESVLGAAIGKLFITWEEFARDRAMVRMRESDRNLVSSRTEMLKRAIKERNELREELRQLKETSIESCQSGN